MLGLDWVATSSLENAICLNEVHSVTTAEKSFLRHTNSGTHHLTRYRAVAVRAVLLVSHMESGFDTAAIKNKLFSPTQIYV